MTAHKNPRPQAKAATSRDTIKPMTQPSVRPYGGTTREDMRRDTYTPSSKQAAVNALSPRV